MIGLAGSGETSLMHARQTAHLINQMKPHLLGLLTTVPLEGTVLFRQVKNGDFTLLDPYEVLEEIKVMLENLQQPELKIDSTHGSNLLPVKGTLRELRPNVLERIERALQEKDNSLIAKAYLGRF